MFNQYNTGYNFPRQQSVKRVPKYMVYNMIAMYVSQAFNIRVAKVEKIDEAPDTLKHSCLYTGVTALPKQMYSLQSDMGVIQIPFYVCSVCGNLYVYQNFYE